MVQQIIVSCKERVTDMAFKKTNEPGLVKVRIAQFSPIYMQKLTLACIWYTCFWSAYDTQSLLVVEKKKWQNSTPKINQYKLK